MEGYPLEPAAGRSRVGPSAPGTVRVTIPRHLRTSPPDRPPEDTPVGRRSSGAAWLLLITACAAHGLAVWVGLGGRAGLTNGWPLWRDDHPLYFHSALITRHFLGMTGTTAG